jgi:hypothetical protein
MYVSRQISKRQNTIKDFKQGYLPLIIPVATCLCIDRTSKSFHSIIAWLQVACYYFLLEEQIQNIY